jgi:hypothetical protein
MPVIRCIDVASGGIGAFTVGTFEPISRGLPGTPPPSSAPPEALRRLERREEVILSQTSYPAVDRISRPQSAPPSALGASLLQPVYDLFTWTPPGVRS